MGYVRNPGSVASHEASADPHTGYQKESEKGQVSGYASLDGSTKVPIAQIPTGSTSTTVPLGDHSHGGGASSEFFIRSFVVTEPPYNAVGDGTNDDTGEIQAALDAADAAGGGLVFFPIGTYKITASLMTYSNVIMMGHSPYLTKIIAVSSFQDTNNRSGIGSVMLYPETTGCADMTVRGICFDHNGPNINPSNVSTSFTMYFDFATRVTIEDCWVINTCRYAILIAEGYGSRVENCRIVPGSSSHNEKDGIHVNIPKQIIIRGNFVDCTGTGADDCIAFQTGGEGFDPMGEVVVADNICTGTQNGLRLQLNTPTGTVNLPTFNVTGNVFYNFQGSGVYMDDFASGGIVRTVNIVGNTFRNCCAGSPGSGAIAACHLGGNSSGIFAEHINIANNTFDTVTGTFAPAIKVIYGRVVNIEGNTCYNHLGEIGVFVEECQTVNINGGMYDLSAGVASPIGVLVRSSNFVNVTGVYFKGKLGASSVAVRVDGGAWVTSDVHVSGCTFDTWVTGIDENGTSSEIHHNSYENNQFVAVTTKFALVADNQSTINGKLWYSGAWDPGTVVDGDDTSTSVTVTGAAVGDMVTVSLSNAGTPDILMYGKVTAANTVDVTLLNRSGASFIPGSGTLRIAVEKAPI